jgi:hypothetical protein
MLWACCGSSAHSTAKPTASAIFPCEAMTEINSAFANPANPCLRKASKWFLWPNQSLAKFVSYEGREVCQTFIWPQIQSDAYLFRIRFWWSGNSIQYWCHCHQVFAANACYSTPRSTDYREAFFTPVLTLGFGRKWFCGSQKLR